MDLTPDQHFARLERQSKQSPQERAPAGGPRVPAGGPRVPAGGPRVPAGGAAAGSSGGDIESRHAAVAAGKVTPEKIRELLHEVIDPELGVDIVELGLLRDVKFEAGVLDVNFTVTTPACPLSEYIEDEIRACVDWLPGVRRVNVNLVMEPPWAPEQMSAVARESLGWSE